MQQQNKTELLAEPNRKGFCCI